MAESSILSEGGGLGFLRELVKRDVKFMVVGASAAVLQGVPLVTQDIDLWFKDLDDPELKIALKRVGGIAVPPIALNPPMFAGESVKLFDIVVVAQGLDDFDVEYERALAITVGSFRVPVLPLERVIVSKRAAGRQKDVAALPALETALKTIELKTKHTRWCDYQNAKQRPRT